MKFKDWLEKWEMQSLRIKPPFLEMEWKLGNADRAAAWELYVELLTRIVTQPLPEELGDEKSALESVYMLFPLTREIIKRHGRRSLQFSKLAIIILNQIVRPFTSKWHKLSQEDALNTKEGANEFRSDLTELQTKLRRYCRMLADVASVEDLTDLEER